MSESLDFVHRYLPAPAEAPADRRVLLLLHGTGGDENDLLPLGAELDPHAALLSPRGKIDEHGQLRFFRRLAEGVFDEVDVVRRAHELADFIVAAGSEYGFTPEHLTAVGYSNGANVAAAILLLRPKVLRSAILLRAMVPLTAPAVPNLHGSRVLIQVGERDQIVPPERGRELSTLLNAGGAEVTLVAQPTGHGLLPADVASAREWLNQH